jgi:hypothetical protein
LSNVNLEGLNVVECCSDCSIQGCVISGKSYCAHPKKGGLHAPEQQDAGALARHKRAIAFLERSTVEAKLKKIDEELSP